MHRRPTPKQYPSDFIGGKTVLSTGYLVSCSRTQRSASGEARTRNPSISGQALYHDCAPQLGSILCRYDTCPTQYAPDLRGSILCMQGTQYAPRESILCMEHFVALHVGPQNAPLHNMLLSAPLLFSANLYCIYKQYVRTPFGQSALLFRSPSWKF